MRRIAIWMGAGIVASWALDALLPSASSPGLRGLLVVAPVVAALLALVAEQVGALRWSLEEAVGAGLLIVLIAGQDRLDLPQTDRLTALLVFGLVAWRIWRLIPGLRKAVGRPGLGRHGLFAAVPLAAYLIVLPWADAARPPNGDEPYYLLIAESLASDFDVDLTDEYRGEIWRRFGDRPIAPQFGDPVGSEGHLYSRHDPLLPLLLAPFWAAGGVAGARLALLLISAALAATTLEACRALGVGDRGAFRAWALLAFAPPVLSLSCQVWVELPAALLVGLALVALGKTLQEDGRWTGARAARFALALALLPLLKLRFLAVAAPLALLGLVGRRGRIGSRLAAVAVVGATAVGLLAVNAWIWGNPLRMHSLGELALFDVPLESYARASLGLGFDVAFGLFAAAPLWLLAIPGAARAVRRPRRVALALVAFVPYFLLVASRHEWYGGWSPPFRYGVVALPAIAAAVGVLLDRRLRAGAGILIAALAVVTALRALAVLAEPGWGFSLAEGRSTLLDVATGDYAIDIARFFPSAIRPRAATWIVPIVTLATIALALRWPRNRPRDRVSAGAALVLLLGSGTLMLARELPTRVAQLEDPWIEKSGGQLWPDLWMFDRTRFDSGWAMFAGSVARIPVVRGSERAEVVIRWRGISGSPPEAQLEARLGDRKLAVLSVRGFEAWQSDRVLVDEWTGDDPLELRYLGPPGPPRPGGVVVDRVEWVWR